MDWQKALEQATAAATAAGDLLVLLARDELTVLSETGRDIKLAADRQAEALIVGSLRESGYPILAEESGEHGTLTGDRPMWVVDPLDGTMNYSRGIPICCVSIALMAGGAPILGVVHDFNRGETFNGIADEGAWLNGAPISVSGVEAAGRAILATGLPAFRDYDVGALQSLAGELGRFRKVRMLGSAALMLAYLAAGRVDAYWEDDILLWDVAAGLAIVQGAGGYVSAETSGRLKWGRRVRCAGRAAVWGPS